MAEKLPLPDDLAALVAAGSITETVARKRAKARRWAARSPEKVLEYAKRKYWKDPAKYKTRSRLWNEQNPEKYREIYRKQNERVSVARKDARKDRGNPAPVTLPKLKFMDRME